MASDTGKTVANLSAGRLAVSIFDNFTRSSFVQTLPLAIDQHISLKTIREIVDNLAASVLKGEFSTEQMSRYGAKREFSQLASFGLLEKVIALPEGPAVTFDLVPLDQTVLTGNATHAEARTDSVAIGQARFQINAEPFFEFSHAFRSID